MRRFAHQLMLTVALLIWCASSLWAGDGDVTHRVIRANNGGKNLLKPTSWQPWRMGFKKQGDQWFCDNGDDAQVQRGASQTVMLNQQRAEPIVARAQSRCEAVSGAPDSNYSLYLDLLYTDGSHRWGQTAAFATGTHDWQQQQVLVFPEKPVRQVSMHMLLRGHSGKAWFRSPELRQLATPEGAVRFDGVPIARPTKRLRGFHVRDVAGDSDFVHIEKAALELTLDVTETAGDDSVTYDVTLRDTSGKDRAITLIYSLPVTSSSLQWYDDPRRAEPMAADKEFMNASRFSRIGANGRLSRYPLGCVGDGQQGVALGIDPLQPAFYRIGLNAATAELFLAYDIGLTPEKPDARVRFCAFKFNPRHRFRAALDGYYRLFPDSFRCRTPSQGLWMPFAKTSEVEDYEDFGFKFKEGNNETRWDDEHGMITFRYTEPMTWWMRMPDEVPRTLDAARDFARRLAAQGDARAKTLATSGFENEEGEKVARILDTPWCNGAVWSMNSMPGLKGSPTDFQLKWNEQLKDRLYGPDAQGELDGEYVDSSEGYVTDELDFDRSHFAAAKTPLCFAATSHRPAIFRGLVAQAYVERIASDVHAMGRLMMANSTPIRLCWLAPHLDVLGTETNWNSRGRWQPMTDAELLYRRAICRGKPYCFLMNTRFEDFSHELVDRYMQRSLAYGMFPGFFSHNASQGHYFTRPELYNRDRPLFQKYVPICRMVAEAGWEPITGASSSDPHVYVERFGDRYFTVFNDSGESRSVTVQFDEPVKSGCRELVGDRQLTVTDGAVSLSLGPEQVAVLRLP